jgi:hypothetical protein
MTSEAAMYRKVPADIERKIPSKIALIPLSTIPSIIPAGVVSENKTISTINTSLSNFDLLRLIPYIK